jgi:hypothetical protein
LSIFRVRNWMLTPLLSFIWWSKYMVSYDFCP